jgi:hypothetical protein
VYTSVVATRLESIFATHNLLKVEYRAGKKKASRLKPSDPQYLFQ